jgi:UDP-N-acetylmuramate: L-alanyl-gamma-D-glutamyl-meso-diaminopimelate ligase
VLTECGRDPGCLVAGVSENLDGSFRDGSGEEFVVEGDEYDTAFFDKTPKFLHYHPQTAILTSVEFDHADIYRDLDHVKSAFRALVEQMPADGLLLAVAGDAEVDDVVRDAPCRVARYAVEGEAAAEWRAQDLRPGSEGTHFALMHRDRQVAETLLPAWGRYNVENALAALAVACERGVAPEDASAALARFRGVRRRQEVRGEVGGVTVLDDFAHHPTAVRETLQAMRDRYPGRRVWAVFEPRTNTSRRKVFQRDYVRALAGADRVVISIVPDTPIYSITGEVTERLDARTLAEDLRAQRVEAAAIDGIDAIVAHVAGDAQSGDVVCIMSNGDFGGVWEKLLRRLRDVLD